jgi:hypothetical protein
MLTMSNCPRTSADILGDIKFPFFDIVNDVKPPRTSADILGDIKFPFFDIVNDIKPPVHIR